MRDVFLPLFSTLRKLIFFAILAIPVLGLIQWLGPKTMKPYNSYMNFFRYIWVFLQHYGDWVLITLISLKLSFNKNTFYQMAERIRENTFIKECRRWADTPYIPPILYFYLVSPPSSFSPDTSYLATNRFYQNVVNVFRNRVYIDAAFSDTSPKRRLTWSDRVGVGSLFPIMFGIMMVSAFFYFLHGQKPVQLWFTGYERFAIPTLAVILSWVAQQVYALLSVGNGTQMELEMNEYFGEVDPKIPWREAFPDRPKGDIILKAWNAECERKQRYYYYAKNRPLPMNNQLEMDNPVLAPFPFPSNDIPNWANDLEEMNHYRIEKIAYDKQLHVQQIAKDSKGKVVSFGKRKLFK